MVCGPQKYPAKSRWHFSDSATSETIADGPARDVARWRAPASRALPITRFLRDRPGTRPAQKVDSRTPTPSKRPFDAPLGCGPVWFYLPSTQPPGWFVVWGVVLEWEQFPRPASASNRRRESVMLLQTPVSFVLCHGPTKPPPRLQAGKALLSIGATLARIILDQYFEMTRLCRACKTSGKSLERSICSLGSAVRLYNIDT